VGEIGFDGLWSAPDGYQLVAEVKTTDSYRINLDTLAGYRSALVDAGKLSRHKSSLLIVVGRQDTGDLEAQIRGSRHAWDIRLISVEALLKLAAIKENLSDAKTAQQIAEVLKPLEYTRVDRLIEIMFNTSEDLQAEAASEEEADVSAAQPGKPEKAAPAKFHDETIERVSDFLKVSLIREGRNRYTTPDKALGISCAVSKAYPKANEIEYWYAFHPPQRAYLSEKPTSYVCYGCGSPNNVLLIPFSVFEPLLEKMWTTSNNQRHYWHVHIFQNDEGFYLGQGSGGERVNITKYHLPSAG